MDTQNKLTLRHESHSVSSIGYHIIWCTKYRKPVLVDGVDLTVKELIGQTCSNNDWQVRALEVMPDHVHVFVQAGHLETPGNIAKTLKSITAVGVFYAYPTLKSRKFWGSGLWSRSTYYGSVGAISQDTVRRYIEQQKQPPTP